MSAPISRLRDAINGTLTTHAAGESLDQLATFYGVPRPLTITRSAWRMALAEIAFGARGRPPVTQRFVEGALADYTTALRVRLDPSRPSQIVSPSAAFTQDMIGRLVRIDGYGLFRVIGPGDVTAAPGYSGMLDLCMVQTPEWDVPNWGSLANPVMVTANILPFRIFDDGNATGVLKIKMLTDAVSESPPYYIQPSAGPVGNDAVGARPDGQDESGYLQASAAVIGNQTVGPYGLYLASGKVLADLASVIAGTLAAGIKCKIEKVV